MHPLQHKLTVLRGRVRRLVVLYGLGWAVAAIVGTVVALGLTDYLLRLQDPGLRVLCSLAIVGVAAGTGYRFLYEPLCVRLRDIDLALQVQKRFPVLEDRLVSAVEFLRQPVEDPLAGSAALRQAVISQTTAETERIRFTDVLDHRASRRAVMFSVGVCLVAAILVALDPTASQIALARLANPFGTVHWPQKTHLALRERVDRVARGQAFEVEVVDAHDARLPSEVQIHYRLEGSEGQITEETELMRPLGNAMVARRENVVRSFSYRVEGGDDHSQPWIDVEVVDPPTIEQATIELIPPAYTGWPPSAGEKHIRALVETAVRIDAAVTKPVDRVVLHFAGQEVAGQVYADGKRFRVPAEGASLRVEQSGPYWFELHDREGLVGESERWEVRAVSDNPPGVTIEQPTTNLFVTTQAVVPLCITAKDDLALRQVTLNIDSPVEQGTAGQSASENEAAEGETAIVPLLEGPAKVKPQPPGVLLERGDGGERRVIDYRWDLSQLRLKPGMQLDFHATAEDYKPQTTVSEPRRLVIITPEQLQDRLASRQNAVLNELARVLTMQRSARTQVEALAIRLHETGELKRLDVDHLQSAELNQRQVNRALTSRSDGVPMHIVALLDDLRNNKVDSPDVERRMQQLLDGLDRLAQEHLPIISRELVAGIKAAQIHLDDAQDDREKRVVAESLEQAGTHQQQVIEVLEQMLGQLARWDNYRRFHRDVGRLLRDQQELNQRSAELGRRTLTKALRDLNPQEAADLRILAARQLELARQLEHIQQAMQQAEGDLRESDPLAADTVADALAEAERLHISGEMRTVGGQLTRNQIGQVVKGHKQVADDLQQVLDILANRREHELARLVKRLSEAEQDLAGLAAQQDGLRKRFEEVDQQADGERKQEELKRLQAEQEQLKEQAERMSRRLQRLLADRASETTHDAAQQMQQAQQQAGGGDCPGAGKSAAEASRRLEEAQQQLAARRLQAQAELVMEQLARLEDAVKHLRRQQEQIVDDTQRYERLRIAQGGQLSRAQATGLSDLARLQHDLKTEAGRLAKKLVGAGAFELTLAGASRYMTTAAEMLERQQTDEETVEAERAALARLELLLEALEPEQPEEDSNAGGGSAPGGQGPQMPGGVQTVAELKLLKLLQQEINLRTATLQEAVEKAGQLTDSLRKESRALGEEQGRLADLVLEMLQPEPNAPEENPDSLPELEEEMP